MARVKICQTHATHSDRWFRVTDSGGNEDKSTRKTAGFDVFTGVFLAAVFLAAVFLAGVFLATTFLAGFPIRLSVRVPMIHVYQNWSLPYANHMAMTGERQPRRVQYRVGLGITVSLVVAGAVALVAWASLANTRAAILELTDQQIRDLLAGLDTRVRDHLQGAVTAVELSENLMNNSVLRDDRNSLARHFTEVLRTNPTFAWTSYSDAMGNFTGAYRDPDASLHVSETTPKAAGAWERHYEQIANDYDPRDEAFYKAAQHTRKLVWIGPVIFYDEGLPGITCAKARWSQDGQLLGVLTVDFNLIFL
jgi:hypothetical protein